VLIPPLAGVGSAFGLLLAPISFDFARSYVTRIEDLVLDRLGSILEEMTASGRAMVGDAGVESDDIRYVYSADIRYVGQGHEISVSLPDRDLDAGYGDRLVQAFEQEYTRLFGRICDGVAVEVVNWRVTVSGPSDHLDVAIESDGPVKETVNRPVVFDHTGPVETPVFSRYGLPIGKITGPAIIEEAESTAVIPPGWEAEVKPDGSLFISRIA
jgi:N-methylhydantoinase A